MFESILQLSIYGILGSKRSKKKKKKLFQFYIPRICIKKYILVLKWRWSWLFLWNDSPRTRRIQRNGRAASGAFHRSNWQFASEELNRGAICIWHWRFWGGWGGGGGFKWRLPEISMKRSLSVCIWLPWEVQAAALWRGKRLCGD